MMLFGVTRSTLSRALAYFTLNPNFGDEHPQTQHEDPRLVVLVSKHARDLFGWYQIRLLEIISTVVLLATVVVESSS